MSIQYRNQTTGILERVAGFNDTDSILSPSSKNPISNKAVYNALLQKIDKTVTDLINYYDKSQVYTKSEVRALIGSINTLTIEVVSELPTQDISTTTIYFVGPKTGTNTYDEYVYVNNAWVKIGDTDIDLTDYVTSSQLTTILQDYYTKNAIDALLSNYYTKTNVDNLLDDKQDILTFDNAPTTGSNNPVTSGGIKTALDTKQDSLTFDNTPTESSTNVVESGGVYSAVDDVYKVMGKNGTKNLLPNNTTSKTINGITFTVNSDGSITANGTATATTEFAIYTNTDGSPNLIGKQLILSGCPEGGNNIDTYSIQAYRVGSTSGADGSGSDFGGGYSFTWLNNASGTKAVIKIIIRNGYVASNLTFYPMLRLASDTDDTYQPYAKTNQQLTEDKAEQAEVNDIVNVYGAKNLLHTTSLNYLRKTNTASDGTWSGNTYTRRGITFTVNNDGSITANGTATADTYFALLKVGELETRDYKLSGCPSGGATDTYCIYTRNAAHNYVYDTGDGVIANMPYSESTINIKIASGQTVSDLTFYPMIRLASITDDTYEPYAETNYQLTQSKMSYADNAILGAKNLINNYICTITANSGITLTTNSDGSIVLNGTVTGQEAIFPHGLPWGDHFQTRIYSVEPSTSYIFSVGSEAVSGLMLQVYYKATSSSTWSQIAATTTSTQLQFITPSSFYDIWIRFKFNNGAVIDNKTFYPMLRLASDPDSTYVPYAMTNQELTEKTVKQTNKVRCIIRMTSDTLPAWETGISVQDATDVASQFYDLFKRLGGETDTGYTCILNLQYVKASDGSNLGSSSGFARIYSAVTYSSMINNNSTARFRLTYEPYGYAESQSFGLWGTLLSYAFYGRRTTTSIDIKGSQNHNTISG